MFCYQCEQTAHGTGCVLAGVCGKKKDVAALQDLLVENLIGVAWYAHRLHQLGIETPEADRAIIDGLFTTVTNVNFDAERHLPLIAASQEIKTHLRTQWHQSGGNPMTDPEPAAATMIPAGTLEELLAQAEPFEMRPEALTDDAQSLKALILFGLKGIAAYAHHAHVLGQDDAGIDAFFSEGLAALHDPKLTADDLVALVMKTGQINLRCMEILDLAHVTHFGHPTPTQVPTGVRKGPAILVSGHDLMDLETLLEQTAGTGITIYTHGEMLPAHGYPGLKKYPHLYGNYGTAWQNQQKEFAAFPGAILMTTNCIQEPRPGYKGQIFTTGLVAWPGVTHVPDRTDFSAVIQKALELGGFPEDREDTNLLVGFGRNAVLSVADQVIAGVKEGKIRHFFLIGGCDGAKPGRNYYTDFAEKTPADTVMLTLACGKYRFNRGDYGNIGGIPRLLDVGQCNDAYSAIKIAVALAEAFGVGVNDLPLSMILSWYEQKAVCILLTLLSLGIKNIRLGPSLPAFVSPNVLQVLVDKFGIRPIGATADEDLKAILG